MSVSTSILHRPSGTRPSHASRAQFSTQSSQASPWLQLVAQQPGLVLVAALAVGILAGWFVKRR